MYLLLDVVIPTVFFSTAVSCPLYVGLAANNETVKNTVVSSTLPVSEHEESTSGPPLASSAVVCATG